MKLSLTFLCVLLLFGSLQSVLAQKYGQPLIDSLLKELPDAKDDTNKVKLLDNISYNYYSLNPDYGIKYGMDGLHLSEKLKWKKGVALINSALGANYTYGKSDFLTALKYYSEALSVYEALGDKKGVAVIYKNIGSIYSFQSNYPTALEYDFKALKIIEETSDKEGIASALANIGGIYECLSDHVNALQYYNKALKTDQQSGNKMALEYDMYNIGLVCLNQKNYVQALENEFESLKIAEEINDRESMATAMLSIGTIYMDQSNYANALTYDFKALRALEEIGRKEYMAPDLGNIGICYLNIAEDTSGTIKTDSLIPAGKMANLHMAIEYLNKGISLAREISDLNNLQIMSKSLSEAQSLSGNYKEALKNYQQFVTTKDSIFNTENNIKITNLETKRALDLKEKQIEIDKLDIVKKRNERWFFFVAIFFLTAMGLLFINRQRLKQKKLEADKKNAEMQKASAESDLAAAQKQLNMFRQSIQEKNHLIEQFSNGLAASGSANQAPDVEMITQLERSIILTDEQWENFKELFEKVYKGFFARLRAKLPDLTQAEVRFLALTKLNLSPKEMASMLGISPNAIRMYRYRLRKKMELDKEEMIEELIREL